MPVYVKLLSGGDEKVAPMGDDDATINAIMERKMSPFADGWIPLEKGERYVPYTAVAILERR